jgi:hypothetical protein
MVKCQIEHIHELYQKNHSAFIWRRPWKTFKLETDVTPGPFLCSIRTGAHSKRLKRQLWSYLAHHPHLLLVNRYKVCALYASFPSQSSFIRQQPCKNIPKSLLVSRKQKYSFLAGVVNYNRIACYQLLSLVKRLVFDREFSNRSGGVF